MRKVLFFLCLLFAGSAAAAGAATQTSFIALDVPGADSTEIHGVIRTGPLLQYVEVVGFFHDARGTHGFVWSRGRYTTINYPGAKNTWTLGINGRQEIVGTYAGSDGIAHGFSYARGTYTKITCPLTRGPGPGDVAPNAVNDAGAIAGTYGADGFVRVGTECVFALHGSTLSINAINNDGEAAASFVDAGDTIHGLTLLPLSPNPDETQVDVPGAAATWLTGINDAGQLVGYYRIVTRGPRALIRNGFVFGNGAFATLDYPGAFRTEPFAVDDPRPALGSYDVVGAYGALFGANHGFIATVTPQAVNQP
jgi:hypothetical protein